MSSAIRYMTMRVHGRIQHLFNVPNTRENWSGFIFASQKGWRIDESFDNGKYTTYQCSPLRVTGIGSYEQEIEKKDWKD